MKKLHHRLSLPSRVRRPVALIITTAAAKDVIVELQFYQVKRESARERVFWARRGGELRINKCAFDYASELHFGLVGRIYPGADTYPASLFQRPDCLARRLYFYDRLDSGNFPLPGLLRSRRRLFNLFRQCRPNFSVRLFGSGHFVGKGLIGGTPGSKTCELDRVSTGLSETAAFHFRGGPRGPRRLLTFRLLRFVFFRERGGWRDKESTGWVQLWHAVN